MIYSNRECFKIICPQIWMFETRNPIKWAAASDRSGTCPLLSLADFVVALCRSRYAVVWLFLVDVLFLKHAPFKHMFGPLNI